ncbi:GntR family transcriptional regulator [Streptomyces sp. NPDC001978]|uniref:GntR family transcriptional regulator n=1 Tax=Streptomyces sp. NPDC001978 TaxID=3364627 RepID=UPI0036B1F303
MDLDRTRPLWRQIAAEIIRRIKDGTYPPGSRVPSTLEIAQEFGVVNATAAKAMRHLQDQGWTRGEVGLGTFVVGTLPPSPETAGPSA